MTRADDKYNKVKTFTWTCGAWREPCGLDTAEIEYPKLRGARAVHPEWRRANAEDRDDA